MQELQDMSHAVLLVFQERSRKSNHLLFDLLFKIHITTYASDIHI